MPAELAAALKKSRVAVNQGARAMLYNAKMTDVVRAALLGGDAHQSLALARACGATRRDAGRGRGSHNSAGRSHDSGSRPFGRCAFGRSGSPGRGRGRRQSRRGDRGRTAPRSVRSAGRGGRRSGGSAAASVPAAEKLGLIAMLLDRSVADPFSGNVHNVCSKLQGHANDLLKQIAGPKTGPVDVAIVSLRRSIPPASRKSVPRSTVRLRAEPWFATASWPTGHSRG